MSLVKINFEKLKIDDEITFHKNSFFLRIKTNFSLNDLKKEYGTEDNIENDFTFEKIQFVTLEPTSSESEAIRDKLLDKNKTTFQIFFEKEDFYLAFIPGGITYNFSPEKEKIMIFTHQKVISFTITGTKLILLDRGNKSKKITEEEIKDILFGQERQYQNQLDKNIVQSLLAININKDKLSELKTLIEVLRKANTSNFTPDKETKNKIKNFAEATNGINKEVWDSLNALKNNDNKTWAENAWEKAKKYKNDESSKESFLETALGKTLIFGGLAIVVLLIIIFSLVKVNKKKYKR